MLSWPDAGDTQRTATIAMVERENKAGHRPMI
jgi:hypothetical protein